MSPPGILPRPFLWRYDKKFFQRDSLAANVIGGADLPLLDDGYDWDNVVLDPTLAPPVSDDFGGFLRREPWSRRHRLPFRHRYLLYGLPGNDKTSIVRVMACHPAITVYGVNFSNEDLDRLYGAVNLDTLEAMDLLRSESRAAADRADGRPVGFETLAR